MATARPCGAPGEPSGNRLRRNERCCRVTIPGRGGRRTRPSPSLLRGQPEDPTLERKGTLAIHSLILPDQHPHLPLTSLKVTHQSVDQVRVPAGRETIDADWRASRLLSAGSRDEPSLLLPRATAGRCGGRWMYSGPRVRQTGIVLGPGLSAGEVHREAEVRADANGPGDDLGMFNGDPYQESMELPEPPFPLVGR